jgi:hypothetical protein
MSSLGCMGCRGRLAAHGELSCYYQLAHITNTVNLSSSYCINTLLFLQN